MPCLTLNVMACSYIKAYYNFIKKKNFKVESDALVERNKPAGFLLCQCACKSEKSAIAPVRCLQKKNRF